MPGLATHMCSQTQSSGHFLQLMSRSENAVSYLEWQRIQSVPSTVSKPGNLSSFSASCAESWGSDHGFKSHGASFPPFLGDDLTEFLLLSPSG